MRCGCPHHSYISDDEDYRFQMAVAVFAQDQGRHSGGKVYEWGKAQLHLKHGLHMRLVNVGAASQVRSGALLGYPLCLVCGASRSAMSSQQELDKFNEHHIERCGRPVQTIAFYAEVVADVLVLQDCPPRKRPTASWSRCVKEQPTLWIWRYPISRYR